MSSQPVHVRLIRDAEAFCALKVPWQALLEHSPLQTAFLTWEWLFPWWLHRRGHNQLRLHTAWQAGELVGIAPLMLELRKKLGVTQRILCSLGTPDMDAAGFVVRHGEREIYQALIAEIRRRHQEWDVLELNEFELGGREAACLLPAFSDHVLAQRDNVHYYLPAQDSWDAYQKSLSQNARGDARRRIRRLQERSRIVFAHHCGSEIAWQDMEAIFAINEHARYPQLYRPASERDFQRELLQHTSSASRPEVFLLYVDDQPVAYRYGFTFGNRFEDWRNGIDMRFSKHSVGKILLWMTLEHCIQRGLGEIDFLRGKEDYKTRWQTRARVYTQLQFIPRTRGLALLSYVWIPGLRRFLKRYFKRVTV